ncbi:hypothetical protein Ssi02_50300 [Sinosporangium siamense]|uniref:Uncharacterized protein n=1 Tax=Sinosporangium siamense TaxID=1367973 RepID=A0A919RLU5_9ACTN|nr:hypothetical protein Ssi02_50300 [Sinosporangium siamense]
MIAICRRTAFFFGILPLVNEGIPERDPLAIGRARVRFRAAGQGFFRGLRRTAGKVRSTEPRTAQVFEV